MNTRSLCLATLFSLTASPLAFAAEGPSPSGQNWHYLSSFEISSEHESLDLDGDGTADAGVYRAMEGLQERILGQLWAPIDAETDYPDQVDECEQTSDGCSLTAETAEAAKAASAQLVEQVVSIESLNHFVSQWVESADYPWAFSLGRSAGAINLALQGGELLVDDSIEGETFLWSYNMGRLQGPTELDEWSRFESENPLRLQLPAGPDTPGGSITLRVPTVEMAFDTNGVVDALLGAGLPVVEVAKILEAWLRVIDAQGVFPEELDIDAVCDELTTAIIDVADMTCSGNIPCLSASFRFSSLPLDGVIIDQPEVPDEIPNPDDIPDVPDEVPVPDEAPNAPDLDGRFNTRR